MLIRRAKDTDIDRINDLLCQVLEIHANARPDIFRHGTKKYNDKELIEILRNDSTPVFVAENDEGYVVGYAFCIHKSTRGNSILADRRELYIDDLCVDREYRGRHIGGQLFEYVRRYAEENKFDAVTLNVWSLNASAVKFYEKCGFSPLKVIMERPCDKK